MIQTNDAPISIFVSRQTYDRLQRLAIPLEDTPDTVIAKLLSMRDAVADDTGINLPDASEVDVVVSDPRSPPSLKHSKLVRAEVAGEELAKPNWNMLRQHLVGIALERSNGSLRSLVQICPVNAVDGCKTDEGFTHYPEIGLSIQGQDANHAWQATASIAVTLNIPVKAWVFWRAKGGAAYPGKRGLLELS